MNFPTDPMRQHKVLHGHDIGDAMDRLVDRASRPEPKQLNRESGVANNAPDSNQ